MSYNYPVVTYPYPYQPVWYYYDKSRVNSSHGSGDKKFYQYHSSEKVQKNEAARVVRNKRKKLDIKVEDEEYPSDQSVDNFHQSDSVTKRRDRKRERKLRPQEGHKNEPFSFS